ncbi:MAG: hypothetical protein U9Q79_00695, partial [Candidatus Hydrogenedentes bacterium]|nr:hypothetical protein [Candidatus Hydrogenedentota bacterium]
KEKTEAESARDGFKARLVDITAGKQTADGEIRTLKLEADGLRKEVSKLREKLQEATHAQERVTELDKALKEVTAHANALEKERDENTKKKSDGPATEKLTNALKEQEKSKKELRKLRAEVQRRKMEHTETPAPKSVSKEPKISQSKEPEQEIVIEETPAPASSGPVTPTLSDAEGRRFKLGEILWEMGVITLEQLEDALEEQRLNPQMKIGVILQEKGYASPEAVAQAVALRAGTQYVEVEAKAIEPDVAGLIPGKLAALHKCIPIRADEETVTLAMANALDVIAIEDVERVSQRRVEPVVATEPVILEVIEQIYEQNAAS